MDGTEESVGLFHAQSGVAAAYRQYALQQMMPLMDSANNVKAEEEVVGKSGQNEDDVDHKVTVDHGKRSSSMLKKARRRRTAFTQVTFVTLPILKIKFN